MISMSAKVLSSKKTSEVQRIQWPRADGEFNGESFDGPLLYPTGDQAEAVLTDVSVEGETIRRLEHEVEMLKAQQTQHSEQAWQQGKLSGEEAAQQRFAGQAEELSARLSSLINETIQAGPVLRSQAEEELVKLAIAVARRILHRELQVDPDAMQSLIRTALSKINQREIQQIRTDPASQSIVEQALRNVDTSRKVEVISDPAMKSGSLVVETTRGHLDASVETQLQEIQRGFVDMVTR